MDEQVSMFDAFEAFSCEREPGPPVGELKSVQFLDIVQIKKDTDNPLIIFQERLRRFFGKESVLKGGELWIPWAGHWTFCIAKKPDDPVERDRGIRYIYRGVYEARKWPG